MKRPTKENTNKLIIKLRSDISNNKIITKENHYLLGVLSVRIMDKTVIATKKELVAIENYHKILFNRID